MHLALAERLHRDLTLPLSVRATLTNTPDMWGAFLLGSVAADARVTSQIRRSETHFYEYAAVLMPPPVEVMFARYPSLKREALHDPQQRAFVAGYVGHLTMDQVWCETMLFPHFVNAIPTIWRNQSESMWAFHLLLTHLDEQDRVALTERTQEALSNAAPHGWLPFMSDVDLTVWRDTIAAQLLPGAHSRTTEVLGKAAGVGAEVLARAVAEDMGLVWKGVSKERVAAVEEAMDQAVRAAVVAYLT